MEPHEELILEHDRHIDSYSDRMSLISAKCFALCCIERQMELLKRAADAIDWEGTIAARRVVNSLWEQLQLGSNSLESTRPIPDTFSNLPGRWGFEWIVTAIATNINEEIYNQRRVHRIASFLDAGEFPLSHLINPYYDILDETSDPHAARRTECLRGEIARQIADLSDLTECSPDSLGANMHNIDRLRFRASGIDLFDNHPLPPPKRRTRRPPKSS